MIPIPRVILIWKGSPFHPNLLLISMLSAVMALVQFVILSY